MMHSYENASILQNLQIFTKSDTSVDETPATIQKINHDPKMFGKSSQSWWSDWGYGKIPWYRNNFNGSVKTRNPIDDFSSQDDLLIAELAPEHLNCTNDAGPSGNFHSLVVTAEWSSKCALIMLMCRVIKVLAYWRIEKGTAERISKFSITTLLERALHSLHPPLETGGLYKTLSYGFCACSGVLKITT